MYLNIFPVLLLSFVIASLIEDVYGGKGTFAQQQSFKMTRGSKNAAGIWISKTRASKAELNQVMAKPLLRNWKDKTMKKIKVRRQNAEAAEQLRRKEYIEHVMDKYGTPVPISRIVKKDKNGKLYSSDKSMQTILKYVYEILDDGDLMEHVEKAKVAKDTLEGLEVPENGCYVTFSVEKDMHPNAYLFNVGTMVPAEDVDELEVYEERETGRREIRKKAVKRTMKKGDLTGRKQRPKEEVEGDESKDEEEAEEAEGKTKEEKKLDGTEAQSRSMDGEKMKEYLDKEKAKGVSTIMEEAEVIKEGEGSENGEEEKKLDEEEITATEGKDIPIKEIKIKEGMDKDKDEAKEGSRNMEEEIEQMIKEEKEKEEEEEEEDEEGPVKMSTYAALLAIQKGRAAFGKKPFLNYENLPDGKMDRRLLTKINKFFEDLIAASEIDEEKAQAATSTTTTGTATTTTAEADDDEIKYQMPDGFSMVDFMERVKQSDGKLKSGEDVESVQGELDKIFYRILRSVRVASDNERRELKAVFEARHKEIKQQMNVDYDQREKLAALNKEDAYNFLKTIRFTINTRPSYIGFKKLSAEEFKEMERLANMEPEVLENELFFLKEKKELTDLQKKTADLQKRIADAMLYEKKNLLQKTGSFFWETGKTIAKIVVEFSKTIGKVIKVYTSKEEQSGEEINRLEKAKRDEEILNHKRRQIVHEAIKEIKANQQQCERLKVPFQFAIYGEVTNAKGEMEQIMQSAQTPAALVMQDVQARLGAQAFNSVVNVKRFPEGHAMAVAMSVGGSGILGIILDVLLVPLLIWGFTGIAGPLPFVGAAIIIVVKFVLKPLLESSTPLVAETFDSAVIKDYMESLKGKKFWRGMKHFRKSIIDATESGMIAAFGSILFNFSMLLPKQFFLVQLTLNILGTFTSAAMVPRELAETRDQTMKAIYKMNESGFFAKPSEEFRKGLAEDMRKQIREWHEKMWKKMFANKYRLGKNAEEESKAAYTNWIEKEAWRSMEVESSTRLSINSLGIGPIVSSIVFTMMQGLQNSAEWLPESVTSAVSVMFNSPTEMISFTGAILGANNFGVERFPWLLSNDEQKNIQIMAKIVEKSTEQYGRHLEKTADPKPEGTAADKKPKETFVEITNEELHKIYNPMINTMGLGKFFLRQGIRLWKKWDQFKQRKQYKQKPSAELTDGTNKDKLIVENWKPGMVYLITMPTTNTVQSLSPKALALELWLSSHKDLPFYRIADGFFIPQLFTQEIPYLEYNGEKFTGTLDEITKTISAKIHNENTIEVQSDAEGVKKFYDDFVVPLERALENERKLGGMDFVLEDKELLEEMISTMSQIYPKLVEYEVDNVESWDTMPWQLKQTFKLVLPYLIDGKKKSQHIAAAGNQQHQIVEGIHRIAEHIHNHMKNGENFLFGPKPTYADAALFGILVQLFETSFSDKDLSKNIDAIKSAPHKKHILHEYYEKWTALKNNKIFDYSYQPNPKYNGQFQMHLAKKNANALTNSETLRNVETFAFIKDIIHEPSPDVEQIRSEMQVEKVPHEWFGSLWKVKKQWKEGEFEQELEKRVEEKKKEMHRENIQQKLLQHYSYPVEAVTDKLIQMVWDSADLVPAAVQMTTTSVEDVNSLKGAEKQLGNELFQIITQYKLGGGELAQNWADIQIFKEFVYYDKAGEIFERQTKDIMIRIAEKFYDEQCKTLVVKQLKSAIHPKGKTTDPDPNHDKWEKRIDELFVMKKRATLDDLTGRADFLFNVKIIEQLLNAVYFLNKQKIEQKMPKELAGLMCYKQNFLDRQSKALKYIDKNRKRLMKAKSREGAIERMSRVFERYIDMKKHAKECVEWKLRNLNRDLKTGKKKLAKSKDKKILTIIEEKLSEWKEIEKSVNQFNDRELVKTLKNEKSELEKRIKQLKDSKKVTVKTEIPAIYSRNEAMREFVIGKIVENEDLGNELAPKKMEEIHKKITDNLTELARKEKDRTDGAKERYRKAIEYVNAKMEQVIMPNQKDAKEQIRAVHWEDGEAKRYVTDKIKKAKEAYIEILNHINNKRNVDPRIVNDGLKTEMISKIEEQIAKFENLIKNVENYNKKTPKTRENILQKLEKINEATILENVKVPKSFLFFIKWEGKISKNDVKSLHDALQTLIGQLNSDQESREVMGELEKIDAKIEAIYEGQKAEKIRLNKFLDNQIGEKEMENAKIFNFPDELCELEKAHTFGLIGNDQQLRKKIQETLKEESKKLCDERKIAFILKELTGYDAEEEKEMNDAEGKQELTVNDAAEGKQEIEMNEHQKYFNRKITEMANEQKEKFQNRKALQVKYPIAKAMLHLMGAYLCKEETEHRDSCGHEQKALAFQELKPLGVKIDEEQLVDDVKRIVFFTIGDFNENFVIREEIVKQYGKPLMDKIEVIMQREQQEEEQKDSHGHGHGQHNHDKAAEIEG